MRVHELTGPKALQVDELPLPEPDDSEVRIDVRAAGTPEKVELCRARGPTRATVTRRKI